jgi:hypothetical protein
MYAGSMTISRQIATLLILAAAASVAAAPKFESVWKSPEVSKLNFAGKKIAALVITDDQSLQISGEEALAKELSARKVNGVTTYRIMPREEMLSAERAKPWFERAGIQGVVALRPVSYQAAQRRPPVVWSSYEQSFYGYYGMGWGGNVGVSFSLSKDPASVVVETLVFNLEPERLVWAATSETKNPKNVQQVVGDLIEEVVKEMRDMKLVPQNAR